MTNYNGSASTWTKSSYSGENGNCVEVGVELKLSSE
ncbi:MAG: DUF397 domain-containing protein [Actinoallomurus sp.]